MNNPTNELIEKVARALCRAEFDSEGDSERSVDELTSEWFRNCSKGYQYVWQAHIPSAKSALSVIPDCGEWRTIESAPRDGTDIILCGGFTTNGRPSIRTGYWAKDMKKPTFYDKALGRPALPYTHWMPLPLPPTEKQKEE